MRETLRETMSRDFPGVIWCESVVGCKRRWGVVAHHNGRVDRIGIIHLSRLDRRPRTRGLWETLRLVRLAQDRSLRESPRERRDFETCTWATRELLHRYRHRAPWWWSMKERERAAHSKDDQIRIWATYAKHEERASIPPPKQTRQRKSQPGESNPNSKLTAVQVAEMRALAQEGASMKDLADRYGISRSQVANILVGRAWKE